VRNVQQVAPGKSSAIYEVLIDYSSLVIDRMLSEHYFSSVELLSDNHNDVVTPWLEAREADSERHVLLTLRDHRTTFCLKWGVFCRNRVNLTFDTNDDVIVSPLDEEWVLYYFHEEIFFWGEPTKKAIGRKATTPFWESTNSGAS